MSALCKIGIHRWKETGAVGLFLFPFHECKRCGAGKISDYMAGTRIVPPEVMTQAREDPTR